MRGRFFVRMGALIAVIVLLLVAAVSALAWAISGLLSAAFGTQPIPGLWVIVLLVLVVGIAGFGRLVRRAAIPVGDLVEAAGRVESGELGVTVTESGPREVRSLARAFNAMSRRLAATNDERRRLLADVSHELRTPLSVIQGTVEGMIDGVYEPTPERLEPILEEVRVLERLVEDLRTLSLADAGQLALHLETVDLGALAADVAAAFEPAATDGGVTLSAPVPAPDAPAVAARVDAVRMRQVIGNLVANALRATPAGGTVRAAVERSTDGVHISVTDSGAGLEPELAARAFERYSRAAGSPGSGLGLPIVRELVRAHGGEVELRSQPGTGTTVTVRLPA
jgi:two-component system sensor histidine kinase BaeS